MIILNEINYLFKKYFEFSIKFNSSFKLFNSCFIRKDLPVILNMKLIFEFYYKNYLIVHIEIDLKYILYEV